MPGKGSVRKIGDGKAKGVESNRVGKLCPFIKFVDLPLYIVCGVQIKRRDC